MCRGERKKQKMQIAKDLICLDRKLRLYHQYTGEVLKYFKKSDMIRFEDPKILLIIAGKIIRK